MSFRSKNKFRNKKVTIDGIKFDSIAEGDYYIFLKNLEQFQGLKILELQPKVYMTKARILYKPDFLIEQDGLKTWIEVKGFETPVYKLKLRLWKFYGPGILHVVKKNRFGFETIERIEPQGVIYEPNSSSSSGTNDPEGHEH